VLATCHNLAFIQQLVQDIREAIAHGDFAGYKKTFLSRYDAAGLNHGEPR
jgi:tRNA-guanine family transglycosylase